jgi:hypothetical protein
MTRIWDFATNLARASKGYLEIQEMVESLCGEKALKKTTFHAIIKKIKNILLSLLRKTAS